MTEVETFVKKFHQLWNDGVTAHLDLDTHGGEAWVGLRVHLGGQVPGPLHRPVHPFQQEVPRKESPSRQRRRARRAAARQAHVERTSDAEAVEASEVVQQTIEEQTAAANAVYAAVEDTAKELAVEANGDPVIDEFCSNVEYNENILSDENSVCYRFIVMETKDIEVFKSKVRQSFIAAEVDICNQSFEISGCEILRDQLKFYLKIRNDEKAIKAIMNLKTENILMMKIPKKKPNS